MEAGAGELHRVAHRPGGADLLDHAHDEVLGGHAFRKLPFDIDAKSLEPLVDEGLRGKDVLDLGSPDAEAERAEGRMGRRVAVAADDDCSRLRQTLLGDGDVLDALSRIEKVEKLDAEVPAVVGEICDLRRRVAWCVIPRAPRIRGVHVIDDGEGMLGTPDAAARLTQSRESLRARIFVQDMPIDVNQHIALVDRTNRMTIDDLVVERACG